jgi:hypothetical protein
MILCNQDLCYHFKAEMPLKDSECDRNFGNATSKQPSEKQPSKLHYKVGFQCSQVKSSIYYAYEGSPSAKSNEPSSQVQLHLALRNSTLIGLCYLFMMQVHLTFGDTRPLSCDLPEETTTGQPSD